MQLEFAKSQLGMDDVWSQFTFDETSSCQIFNPNPFKKDLCVACHHKLTSHRRDAVQSEDHALAALEYSQKGQKVPSCILGAGDDGGDGLGGLLLGGYHAAVFLPDSVTHVINCAKGLDMFGPKYTRAIAQHKARGISFLELDWEDHPEQEIAMDLSRACVFIEESRKGGGDILVHCAQGKSRSSTVVVAYLLAKYPHKFNDVPAALTFAQTKRKMAQPNR